MTAISTFAEPGYACTLTLLGMSWRNQKNLLRLADYRVCFDLNKHFWVHKACDDCGHGYAQLLTVFSKHSRESTANGLNVLRFLYDLCQWKDGTA